MFSAVPTGRLQVKGVTGIVMNPYKESKKDGARGFMRGMGKGLIGAVVKPTTGVLDLATDISTGIKKEVVPGGATTHCHPVLLLTRRQPF